MNIMATGGEDHGDVRGEEDQHPRPSGKPVVERVDTAGHPLVFFNVETTGFERDRHVTQIAACTDSGHTFNTFVWPNDPDINDAEFTYAEEASGIEITGGRMLHHNEPVEPLTIRPALEQFITFLGQQGKPVVLVGYNIQGFGSRPLVKALQNCDLVKRFQEVVHCFVDIYLGLKGKRLSELRDLQIPTLYRYCTGESMGPSDARKDVETLKLMTQKVGLQSDDLRANSFTTKYIIDDLRHVEEKAQSEWMLLKERGLITDYMVEKALQNGLELDKVRQEFQDRGEEAARQLLRARLTTKEEIINTICAYLLQETRE